MIFTSLHFLVFLPLVLLGYYSLPISKRWVFLLLASYIFYAGWKIEYLPLIIASTLIDFSIALLLFKTAGEFNRKLLLSLSLISNFGMLILFKYFHFLIGGSGWFKSLAAQNESILWLQFIFEYGIPVGISFYTFQTVSYTLDVFHKRIEPEKNLGKFALFVTFFPQLVAGPIERFSHLHPQLFHTSKALWSNFRAGLQIMLFGFFLKMVIGDNLGEIISPVFDSPENFSLGVRWISVGLFALQIYTDFNGYSVIAVGCARMFGIHLMDNFNQPYRSLSIREFWSRWHISLSTWFRDYVYIPLGGAKKSKQRWLFAIILTFFLSGLWHGAAANFIYWGLLHGFYYLIEQVFFPIKKGQELRFSEKTLRWIITLSIVLMGWLLFRINNLNQLKYFFQKDAVEFQNFDFNVWLLLPFALFFLFEIALQKNKISEFIDQKSFAKRWTIYSILLIMLFLFANTGELPFIYFQF